ncbi:MAG: hypothetical protein GY941_16330 [Planctomycetes bacterium]|nr:hypothetical protein [Planctomycetota bacterium]
MPKWLIRYEKLFKIVYKISIMYLIINAFLYCFSMNIWYAVGSISFFVLSKTNLWIVGMVKGQFRDDNL